MKNIKYNKETLNNIVIKSSSLREVAIKLGYSQSGGAATTLKKYIKLWDIDTSHFLTSAERILLYNKSIAQVPVENYLKKDSKITSNRLKGKLYKAGIKFPVCEICNQKDSWNERPLVLILDHINGDNTDNRLENLRIVCPNCNSQLDTFGAKNRFKRSILLCLCGNLVKRPNKKYCSSKCRDLNADKDQFRKVERPNYQQLLKDVNELSMVAVGKKYGVSDNAIRKWLKYYHKKSVSIPLA